MLITKGEQPVLKGYKLYESISVMFWKRQNYGHSKTMIAVRGSGKDR
jgi:hypothetical protein